MNMQKLSRRDLLAGSIRLAPAIAVLSLATKHAAAAECADPTEGLRASLHYVETSRDPKKSCNACGFFTPDPKDAACGACMIFNGPANAKGHCDSWAAKGNG